MRAPYRVCSSPLRTALPASTPNAARESNRRSPHSTPHYEFSKLPPFVAFENSQTALEFSTQQLDRFTTLLRAIRTARLDAESAFDPAIHVDALDRFDWQAAEASELLALPPVLVRETAERLAQS